MATWKIDHLTIIQNSKFDNFRKLTIIAFEIMDNLTIRKYENLAFWKI